MFVTFGSVQKSSKCACCGERIRKFERALIVRNSRQEVIRGGVYCPHHDIQDVEAEHGIEHEVERGEEYAREQFGRYREAGCASSYFTDKENGYV